MFDLINLSDIELISENSDYLTAERDETENILKSS